MDKSAGLVDDEKDNYDTIISFVARYLNAVKLGLEKITEWSDTSEPGDTPPSACDALDEEDRNLLHLHLDKWMDMDCILLPKRIVNLHMLSTKHSIENILTPE